MAGADASHLIGDAHLLLKEFIGIRLVVNFRTIADVSFDDLIYDNGGLLGVGCFIAYLDDIAHLDFLDIEIFLEPFRRFGQEFLLPLRPRLSVRCRIP